MNYNEFKVWVNERATSTGSGFFMNLKCLLDNEYMLASHMNLYSAGVSIYMKNIAESKIVKKVSEFVGNINDKIKVSLTFINSNSFETMYGISTLHRFADEQGNIFIWFTSSYTNFSTGNVYEVTATIKDHKEYGDNKIKQTQLLRVKVLKEFCDGVELKENAA